MLKANVGHVTDIRAYVGIDFNRYRLIITDQSNTAATRIK